MSKTKQFIKDMFSPNDVGIMDNKKRIYYEDLFFNQYGDADYKEDYAGYLIYTLTQTCLFGTHNGLSTNTLKYMEERSKMFSEVVPGKDRQSLINNIFTTGMGLSTDGNAEFDRTCRIANLISTSNKIDITTANFIRDLIIGYRFNKRIFFEVIAENIPFILFFISQEYSHNPEKLLSPWKNILDEGTMTNITAYYYAKTLEFLSYLDSIKDSSHQLTSVVQKMFGSGISGDKDAIFDKDTLVQIRKEIMTNAVVGNDEFHNCLQSAEKDYFERAYLKEVPVNPEFANYIGGSSRKGFVKLHRVISVLSVINKFSLNKEYVLENIYRTLEIVYAMPRIINFIMELALVTDTSEKFTLQNTYDAAVNKNKELLDIASEEKSALKKDVKQKKQEISKLQGKCMNLQVKVDRLTESVEGLKNKENTDDLKIRIESLEKEKRELDAKLNAVIAEKKELLSDLTKLSKDYKALNAKVYELHMDGKDLIPEVSEEEKVNVLNNYSILIVGGTNNSGKLLKQQGFHSFDQAEDARRINKQVRKYDVVVVCTKFCSHSMSNAAASKYSKDQIYYFNQASCTNLMSEIYDFIMNKKNSESEVTDDGICY